MFRKIYFTIFCFNVPSFERFPILLDQEYLKSCNDKQNNYVIMIHYLRKSSKTKQTKVRRIANPRTANIPTTFSIARASRPPPRQSWAKV